MANFDGYGGSRTVCRWQTVLDPTFRFKCVIPVTKYAGVAGCQALHPTTYLQIMIELEDNVDSGRFIQDGFPMASRQDPPHI